MRSTSASTADNASARLCGWIRKVIVARSMSTLPVATLVPCTSTRSPEHFPQNRHQPRRSAAMLRGGPQLFLGRRGQQPPIHDADVVRAVERDHAPADQLAERVANLDCREVQVVGNV